MNQTIGIAIPCFNEEKYIEKCILSILKCDYDTSKIIIAIADGMSTDNTRSIIRELQAKHNNIHLLDNKAKVTPVAINMAMKFLETEIKILLGAHAEVAPDFVSNNIKILESFPDVGCCGGIIHNIYENESSKIIGKAMSSPFGVGNARFRTGGKDGYVDTVAFGAYRQEVFDKIGYFDESLVRNQDDEFNYRVIQNGYKIYLSNTINSNYYVRASNSKLAKQYYQYGYWKVYVNKKVKAITSIRQLFPALLVTAVVTGAILSLFHLYLLISFIAGLVFYIVLAVFFAIKKSNSFSEIIQIVWIFMILHFSYGTGYIKGVLDFILLSKKPSKSSTEISR